MIGLMGLRVKGLKVKGKAGSYKRKARTKL